jgi:quercetin dioxygenase-like cupin family protein
MIDIKQAQEGEYWAVAGGNYRIVITGAETNGSYAVIEMTVPPGGGPPPHAHPDIQETFYVLDGSVTFSTAAGSQTVTKGGFVHIPLGGAVHCFKNTSDQVATLLCTVMPAGLEEVFRAIGQPAAPGQFLPIPEPTPERIALIKAIEAQFNQQTYPRDYFDRLQAE